MKEGCVQNSEYRYGKLMRDSVQAQVAKVYSEV